MYQRVNSELETAVNLGWTSSNNATNFGIGCKYALDKDSNIRAKINNSSQVGLGYQQKLRPGNQNCLSLRKELSNKWEFILSGVTLTLSTIIDGKNFNQGGHKVGVALELEA